MTATKSSGQWHAVEYPNGMHVVPIDDLIEHTYADTDCICGPEIEIVEIGAPLVIVHSSLDGRELGEPDYEEGQGT